MNYHSPAARPAANTTSLPKARPEAEDLDTPDGPAEVGREAAEVLASLLSEEDLERLLVALEE